MEREGEERALAPEIEHLAAVHRGALRGPSWHGPSVVEALGEVDAAAASRRPIGGAHTIWEIVRHIENGRALEGGFRTLPVAAAPRDVVEIGVRAARLIGRGLYGVDIKATERGVFVIEINDNPNLVHEVEDAAEGPDGLVGLDQLLLVDARRAQQHLDLAQRLLQARELRLVERGELVPPSDQLGEPLELLQGEVVGRILVERATEGAERLRRVLHAALVVVRDYVTRDARFAALRDLQAFTVVNVDRSRPRALRARDVLATMRALLHAYPRSWVTLPQLSVRREKYQHIVDELLARARVRHLVVSNERLMLSSVANKVTSTPRSTSASVSRLVTSSHGP